MAINELIAQQDFMYTYCRVIHYAQRSYIHVGDLTGAGEAHCNQISIFFSAILRP